MATKQKIGKGTPKKKGVAFSIRMYRQGLGDCFLVTLPKKDGSPYYLLIDCGVVIGTSDATAKMEQVVRHIIATTGGRIDTLAVTHEHWDHVSAFVQVASLFAKAGDASQDSKGKLQVSNIWFAWTEDPKNPLAAKLKDEARQNLAGLRGAERALREAATAMGLAKAGAADRIGQVLGFFGAAGDGGTSAALSNVRGLAATEPEYRHPGEDPIEIPGVPGFRIFVLGPPESEAQIKKTGSTTELYKDQKAAALEAAAWNATIAALSSLRAETQDQLQPFDSAYRIPLPSIQASLREKTGTADPTLEFFDRYYYGKDTSSAFPNQNWRRIDGDWLGVAEDFALQLDNATNNTSLVLAIENIASGDIYLLPADAQVGNWLSWHDCSWTIDGKKVTGADLLRRTVFYKVGHHGSHNATLKAKGLELMTSGRLAAFLPVDQKMAAKKGWGAMPLSTLVEALKAGTRGRLVRIDEEFDSSALDPAIRAGFQKRLTATPLYYELTFG